MKVNTFPVGAGVLVCSFLAVSGSVSAYEKELAPGLYPSISAGVLRDDNIWRTPSAQKSDSALLFEPSILYKFLFRKHSFDAVYDGQYAKYADYSDENYADHDVGGRLKLDLAPAMKLELAGRYLKSHDLRGVSTTRKIVSQKPDLWNRIDLSGEFIYGRRESSAQIGVFVGSQSIDYTNNNQYLRDRTINTFRSTFYYNVTSKSAWLLELDRRGIGYANNSEVNRDSVEMRYLAGARWSATAQTEGEIRLGILDKSFEAQDKENFTGLTVRGKLSWEPLATDRVVVEISRMPRESPEVSADYFVENSLKIRWGHVLTDLVTFTVGSLMQRDNHSGENSREDAIFALNVGLNVSLLTWLDLEGSYGYSTRASNLDGLDYDGNVFKLAFVASPSDKF
ncbi:MAG: outer membrane beta-barrel protein [Gammaproteobacteria bacterium]|nr:outer membrane beta-barrel protein [Gammaproteobacteria bacterium]